MAQRLEVTVRGQVQGVGYRWFARRQAARLSVTGWVANLEDGSVRVVAEGSSPALARLLAFLRSGPPGAIVRSVEESWRTATGEYAAFEIRAGRHSGD